MYSSTVTHSSQDVSSLTPSDEAGVLTLCLSERTRCVSVYSQCRRSLFVHLPCFSWHVLHRKTKVTPPHSFFFSLSTSVVKNVSIWILEQQAGGNAQGVVKYSRQADRQCKLYNPDLKEGIENTYLSRREDWAKAFNIYFTTLLWQNHADVYYIKWSIHIDEWTFWYSSVNVNMFWSF